MLGLFFLRLQAGGGDARLEGLGGNDRLTGDS